VEFVAATADRVALISEGEVIADASTAEVVLSSPTYAPQVAKILAPEPWLTVSQVAVALRARQPQASDETERQRSPEVLR
jgi:energy-coupling factor transport system ATP-binding protein